MLCPTFFDFFYDFTMFHGIHLIEFSDIVEVTFHWNLILIRISFKKLRFRTDTYGYLHFRTDTMNTIEENKNNVFCKGNILFMKLTKLTITKKEGKYTVKILQ